MRLVAATFAALLLALLGAQSAFAQDPPNIPSPSLPPGGPFQNPGTQQVVDPLEYLNHHAECEGLSRGASGPCVTALQQALTDGGYPVLVDGKWGPVTDATVRYFETDMRARVVNGILDEETIYLLGAAHDTQTTRDNIVKHEDGFASKLCEFTGPAGPTCDDLLSPEPAG